VIQLCYCRNLLKMAPNLRIKKACDAMKLLGISETKTRAFLRKLLKTYENNWDFIEEDAYKVLLDAIFDEADAQVCFFCLITFYFLYLIVYIFSLSQFSFFDMSYGSPLKKIRRKRKRRRRKRKRSPE